jgi:hypothetical protein
VAVSASATARIGVDLIGTSGTQLAHRARPAHASGPLVAALAALALHALCWSRYGVFRDELYFIVCGERLAAGYVDQPPLIALVARAAHALFGTWVPGLRLLPWVASSLAVWLAGRLALRLGAGGFGAALASVAVATSPLLSVLGHYLTMNAFEPLLWLALALVVVRVAQSDDPRLLVAAGALAGLAALNKYSAVLFELCLAAGLLATPARRALASRFALAGVGVAALAVLPNAVWQARQGLPFLELARNGVLYKNAPFALREFAVTLAVVGNPAAAPLWLGGLGWLLAARGARPFRFLGVASALLLAVLVASKGKFYYAAPLLPILLAAGAAALDGLVRSAAARAAAVAAVAAVGLALAPIAMPLLAPEQLVAYMAAVGYRPPRLERLRESPLPQIDADQFGWEEMARAVAAVYAHLPEGERREAVVFGQNYGEAAAIDVYGAALGLPPAVSGHNNYFVWGVPPGRGAVVITISNEREDCAHGFFRRRELAARLPESPWAMPYENGRWIWICRDPKGPLASIWPSVRNYM